MSRVYCLLHEDWDKKDEEETREQFYKEIEGGETNFEGCVLPGFTLFEKKLVGQLRFRDATIANGDVTFIKVMINGGIDFDGAIIDWNVSFFEAIIKESVVFTEALIGVDVGFEAVKIKGKVLFEEAVIAECAVFKKATI